MQKVRSPGHIARHSARRGDYACAVAAAERIAPGKEAQLQAFKQFMERYEVAKAAGHWRRAVRALVGARSAAVAAGLPELERVVTARLRQAAKRYAAGQS